ncbi:MAG: hypothetical protein H6636_03155 [Anaerolineales bacterium]|nr:hypothetical protein [Anaerolineales bacterium]
MIKQIFFFLLKVFGFSVLYGVGVLLFGFYQGWETSRQFSDGFFWAAIMLLGVGYVTLMGRMYQPTFHGSDDNEFVGQIDREERFKRWMEDYFHNHQAVIFVGACGALVMGMSVLVSMVEGWFW